MDEVIQGMKLPISKFIFRGFKEMDFNLSVDVMENSKIKSRSSSQAFWKICGGRSQLPNFKMLTTDIKVNSLLIKIIK